MKKIQCQLCGRDIEYEYLAKKAQCTHCGIYAFFDEYGTLTAFDVNPDLYEKQNEPEESENIADEEVPEVSDISTVESSEKKTNILTKLLIRLRPVLKPILIVTLCIALLFAGFFALEPQIKVFAAKQMIEDGEYEKAYLTLKDVENYGPAKELLSKFTWKYSRNVQKSTYSETSNEYEYDSHGNTVIEKVYSQGNLVRTVDSIYEDGLLMYKVTNSQPTITLEKYKYDEDGRCIKTETVHDSTLNRTYEYAYDNSGRLIYKTVIVHRETGDYKQEYAYAYNNKGHLFREDFFENGEHIMYYGYSYNEDGKCTKKIRGGDDNEVTIEECEYDSKGRLVKRKQSGLITRFIYNKKGKIVNERVYVNDSLSGEIVYTYNSDGLLIKKITKGANGDVQHYVTYTYDKYGNNTSISSVIGQSLSSVAEATETFEGYVIFYNP